MSQNLSPKIIFEDMNLVVLSKPAGLLSQGEATGDENLVDWLRAYFGRNYVGLVHRLDRNTSGLMVVAKRTKAAERLTKSLQNGELERAYLAILEGSMVLSSPQVWEQWLVKDEQKNLVEVYTSLEKLGPQKTKLAKKAVLKIVPQKVGIYKNGFGMNAQGRPVTLAQFELETGRSHQIRAQAQAAGFPLLGDVKYGCQWSADFGRPALHSFKISFPHPISKDILRFEEELPADMKAIPFS